MQQISANRKRYKTALEISQDVEYSFTKNRYNIFVISSRTTFHHVEQKTLNHFKSKPQSCCDCPLYSYTLIPAYIVLKLSPQRATTLPAHVAEWSVHPAAMCSRAWHTQWSRFTHQTGRICPPKNYL